MAVCFRFGPFLLDPGERRLLRGTEPVELNGRYLDALALLVREPGRLISKERFLEEVWQGVPVTDEALTQCIRTLRKRLGDDAGAPRFIETAPKHGYRFIAAVETVEGASAPTEASTVSWRTVGRLGGAGALGGGVAGAFGGVFYSFFASEADAGAASVLLVLTSITTAVGLLGGAGVAFGIAAAARVVARPLLGRVLGGAVGGFLVGAFVKLVGIDALRLVFGRAPGEITGGPEGALLGAAVGLGAWAAQRAASASLGRRIAPAALATATAGVVIAAFGGRMMAGSLDLLAQGFPQSRLRLDEIGRLVGEPAFGPLSQMVTAGLEGLLFGACVVGALALAQAPKVNRTAGAP